MDTVHSYETIPHGSVALSITDFDDGSFNDYIAFVHVPSLDAAAQFVDSLPVSCRRRIFVRVNPEGGAFISSYAQLRNPTAIVLFKRFVRAAFAAGFTPLARIVSPEKRGAGRYAEAEDVQRAFADVLPG